MDFPTDNPGFMLSFFTQFSQRHIEYNQDVLFSSPSRWPSSFVLWPSSSEYPMLVAMLMASRMFTIERARDRTEPYQTKIGFTI
jgi:hypothetical protein